MIYWISGAYGVGKSTVAEQLKMRLAKAHIFDAEEVGNAVRDNYPKECRHSIVFEGYPLWRELNYRLLKDINSKYDGDIIVPMTLILDVSYTEIIRRLIEDGIYVGYVILDGDRQTVHDRILKRGEDEECWCMKNIQTCIDAQRGDKRAVHINTIGRTPGAIADEIIERFKA